MNGNEILELCCMQRSATNQINSKITRKIRKKINYKLHIVEIIHMRASNFIYRSLKANTYYLPMRSFLKLQVSEYMLLHVTFKAYSIFARFLLTTAGFARSAGSPRREGRGTARVNPRYILHVWAQLRRGARAGWPGFVQRARRPGQVARALVFRAGSRQVPGKAGPPGGNPARFISLLGRGSNIVHTTQPLTLGCE